MLVDIMRLNLASLSHHRRRQMSVVHVCMRHWMWKAEQEIHLGGKPESKGKQNHRSEVLISEFSSSRCTPGSRCWGGELEYQRSRTGTEPGRCSDQTFPHSERGRSSPDLQKTFKPQNADMTQQSDHIWKLLSYCAELTRRNTQSGDTLSGRLRWRFLLFLHSGRHFL